MNGLPVRQDLNYMMCAYIYIRTRTDYTFVALTIALAKL